ncbi:nucleoside hydrolase [Marisediminicola sp. LYQ134]|uniref:nucleoside hydrolase n=1 Tax=Marisediminicola sp. LYQ134 TaxID=3391061 RepID=UPI00398330AC
MAKILLDCDPGLDDALALLLAHGDPDIDLVAVTTVGGNVSLANTTRNALRLREYLGFDAVPIAAGAEGPLTRPAANAEHVHGAEGLGTVRLPEAELAASELSAVDLIIREIDAAPGEVHLVATGPLTNIALTIRRDPSIVERVASFVIMGGSFTRGNATPAAEFNIFADPEAAEIVFAAGWTVVMVGLDLTLQAIADAEILARMAELGPVGTDLAVPLATFWTNPDDAEWRGQAVHDVCAVAHVTHPELFQSRRARVEVETAGHHTTGMTVVDFASAEPNAIVPVRLDVDGFWDYALGAWGRVGRVDRAGTIGGVDPRA